LRDTRHVVQVRRADPVSVHFLFVDPALAAELNLQDVLARLQRSGEVRRLRDIISEREEALKQDGRLKRPNHTLRAYLPERMPDGTLREQLPLEEHEQLMVQQAVQQYKLDKEESRKQNMGETAPFGTAASPLAATQGIRPPRQISELKPPSPDSTGHFKRATYERPIIMPMNAKPQGRKTRGASAADLAEGEAKESELKDSASTPQEAEASVAASR
jgi:hypothetical protein